jgi:hypothetical protein
LARIGLNVKPKFLVAIEDADGSAMTAWEKVLAQKNQTKKAVEEFLNVLENQMGSKVKTFRIDREGEFWNKDMAKLCAARGFVHQKTNPYSS